MALPTANGAVGVKKDPEALDRERKKLKKKARRVKAQAFKADAPERERAKELAKASGQEFGQAPADDDENVEYVAAQLGFGDDPAVRAFAEVFEKFKVEAPEEPEAVVKEEKPKKISKARLLDDDDSDSSAESGPRKVSKRKKKEASRMSIASLKQCVKRPDVIESWDTTSTDARLLVYLKAYRNTVPVPKHWSAKRRYMANKRGFEKPPYKLPDFIESTGIAKIREAVIEKQAAQSMKGKQREKVRPKAGKLDIDYQVLHDAFFKYSSKPMMTRHGEVYYEGKENEVRMQNKKPGQLSDTLMNGLGMQDNGPPPWLINMQRYGPPPSYPSLKIPGLNAPIPSGAQYGYHPGGWGKPPVNEFGQPLYGTYEEQEHNEEKDMLWGEVEELTSDEEDDEEGEMDDGAATPALGTQTPFGVDTPMVSMGSEGGVHSISGVSSVTSGMDTPASMSMRGSRKHGVSSVSGISSATMTPQPQLFQVLEEQKTKSGRGLFPSQHGYAMGGSRTPAGIGTPMGGISTPHGIGTPMGGISTPMGGIGTPMGGISTPLAGISTPIGGIGTPIGGIGTPMAGISTPIGGISTPIGGIATPLGGIATPIGGINTPIGGIATPIGGIATPIGGIATPIGGIATPIGGIATPQGVMTPMGMGGSATPAQGMTMSLNPDNIEQEGILTADIIRQQLKQHEDAAAKARAGAHQKAENERKRKSEKSKTKTKKFKF